MQPGFFDVDQRHEEISRMGDPLKKLNECIPWDNFLLVLSELDNKERKNNAGRKAYPAILMFKIIILQSLYNLSDNKTEYMIRDRLSFMRFLELKMEDKVPDEKSIWLFRERLKEANLMEPLFQEFNRYLNNQGFDAKKGQIIDTSIIPVPKQRNKREENREIKEGITPEKWKENPNKLRQKDIDARWTTKHKQSHYGYKNHINVDAKHKLIREYAVTTASIHDSQCFEEILDHRNSSKDVYVDSAYRSEESDQLLKDLELKNKTHYRAYRNKPLSEHKQQINKKRSSTRVRVEHIFGFMQNSMGGKQIRGIGIARAKLQLGIRNFTYNLCRYGQLLRIEEAV